MSNSDAKFDDYDIKRYPLKGIIGALLGMIPGCILWLILGFYTPIGGTMGILITIGLIIGFYKGANYITYKIKNLLMLLGFTTMLLLSCCITAYTIHNQYINEVISEQNVYEITESFITDLNNNGRTKETNEQFLKDTYNINWFNDKKGFNKLAKDTLGEVYMEEHKVSCVPNNPINAFRCLYSFILNDNDISKPFIYTLISGIIFSILTCSIIIKFDSFKPLDV